MEKLVFSISETAEVLGIGKSLCYRLAKANQLPVIQLGSRYVVPKSALERFINEGGQDKLRKQQVNCSR